MDPRKYFTVSRSIASDQLSCIGICWNISRASISTEFAAIGGQPVDPLRSCGKNRRIRSPSAIGQDLDADPTNKFSNVLLTTLEFCCFVIKKKLSRSLCTLQSPFDSLKSNFSILPHFFGGFQWAASPGSFSQDATVQNMDSFTVAPCAMPFPAAAHAPTKKKGFAFNPYTIGFALQKYDAKIFCKYRWKSTIVPAPPSHTKHLHTLERKKPLPAWIPNQPAAGRLFYHPSSIETCGENTQ